MPYGAELDEGVLVQYVGFLLDGHLTVAEGVNCDRTTQNNDDVHMAFVNARPPATITQAQGHAPECSSITAGIIPDAGRANAICSVA